MIVVLNTENSPARNGKTKKQRYSENGKVEENRKHETGDVK